MSFNIPPAPDFHLPKGRVGRDARDHEAPQQPDPFISPAPLFETRSPVRDNFDDHETWERGSTSHYTTGSEIPSANYTSVDRPQFLALIQLVQLTAPDMFLEINPLLLIGTLDPEIPVVSDLAIQTVNDMVGVVWGNDKTVVVPIVFPRGAYPPGDRKVLQPVEGLRIKTKMIVHQGGTDIENSVAEIKTNYKYQDAQDCIDSGRQLIKLTLLGRLRTKPSKSILKSKQDGVVIEDNPGFSRGVMTRPRARSSSRRRSSHSARRSDAPYEKERNSKSLLGRLRSVLLD